MNELKDLARNIFDQALADCSIERSFDRMLHIDTAADGPHLILANEDIRSRGSEDLLRIWRQGK